VTSGCKHCDVIKSRDQQARINLVSTVPVSGEIFLFAFVPLVHGLMSQMNTAHRPQAWLRLTSYERSAERLH